MELIIKPTERCNFKCTFCSSTHLVDDAKSALDLESIYQFLKRFPETSTIIVNGGDPLMMPPQYYYSILNYIKNNNLKTILSFTTNLWAFYKAPQIWLPLFKEPNVFVTTSFNYGTTRRITNKRVFLEEDFRAISDLFLNKIGYRPGFISVITDENYDTAIDNVLLAEDLNVECKLNYAYASGEQASSFLKGKIYKVYLQIIREQLHPWEYNSKQILKKGLLQSTTCPVNRSCDSSIRCLQPEGDYYSCGAFGDDKQYPINFNDEVLLKKEKILPLATAPELFFLKEQCLSCPLFEICNGCKKTIHDLKKQDRVEQHCTEMIKVLPELSALINTQTLHEKNQSFH